MSYTTIEGKKMNSPLLEQASKLVQGSGDGRISIKDAEILLAMVKADDVLTETEKNTIDHLLRNFRWTSAAEEWFHQELKAWHSRKAPVYMTLDELRKRHYSKSDVLSDAEAKSERNHLLASATSVTHQDHEEIGLWIRLEDGTSVEVVSRFIELEGEFVQLHGGCLIPVRAIERVEM